MQNTSDNEFDAFFRDKLGSFEVQPSASLWDRIGGELDKTSRKGKVFPIWWAAASVVCLLTCGYWFTRTGERIKLKAVSAERVVSQISVKPGLTQKEHTTIASPAGDQQAGKRQARLSEPLFKTNKILARNNQRVTGVTAVKGEEQQKPLMSEKTVALAVPVVEEKLAMPTPPPVVLASNNNESEVHEEKAGPEEKQHNGIKSVGDLVNFVVAKVDKRKDKIIEFAEDDEGSVISGINLGVLRIRTKGEKRN